MNGNKGYARHALYSTLSFLVITHINMVIMQTTASDSSSCRTHVCFNWKIKSTRLVLVCKIDALNFPITFYDPQLNEVGFCVPHRPCVSLLHKANITKNNTLHEIIVSIPLNMQLNGWWTCTYGANNERAVTEVTLQDVPSNSINGNFYNIECWTKTMLWCMLGFACSFLLLRLIIFVILFCLQKLGTEERIEEILRRCRKCSIDECCEGTGVKLLILFSLSVILVVIPVIVGLAQGDECTVAKDFSSYGAIVGVIVCWLMMTREVICTYVQLEGPEYSIKNSTILLNCSSVAQPVGLYAEFLINGRSYTNIRRNNESCLTGQKDLDCIYHNCLCSTTGLWYALQFEISSNLNTLVSKCVMKFSVIGQQSSEVRTTILDIKGPSIEASSGLPIAAGIQTDLNCIAFASNVDIKLVWNCMNLQASKSVITNSTEHISTLTFMPLSVHNGINCSCKLQAVIHKYSRSTSFQLDIINSPVLKLNPKTDCINELSIVLTCEVSGELFNYGFRQWIHSFNGVFVRKLDGIVLNNTTSVIIKSCGYQDTGSYTCIAWNEYGKETLLANKTSIVKVLGPPVVVQSHTSQDQNTLLTVKFYSISEPYNVQWYLFNEPIINASTTVLPTEIVIIIYGNKITSDGYYSNISLENQKIGRYSAILENKYGKTKQIFEVIKKGYAYKLKVLLWILTGVAVFISTVTLTTLILRRRNSGIFFTEKKPVIYHAAPHMEPHVLPYNDIQDNPYDDCHEDPTGAPYYIDVIDSEEEITVPESSCQYEEINV